MGADLCVICHVQAELKSSLVQQVLQTLGDKLRVLISTLQSERGCANASHYLAASCQCEIISFLARILSGNDYNQVNCTEKANMLTFCLFILLHAKLSCCGTCVHRQARMAFTGWVLLHWRLAISLPALKGLVWLHLHCKLYKLFLICAKSKHFFQKYNMKFYLKFFSVVKSMPRCVRCCRLF